MNPAGTVPAGVSRVTLRRRVWPRTSLGIATLCAAACGAAPLASPSAAPRRTPTPAPAGPQLRGTIQTSENTSLTTTFRAPLEVAGSGGAATPQPGLTCAAYAAAPGGVFVPPQFDVTSAGHSVYFAATVGGYHGPGDYQSAGSGSLGGTIAVGVNVGAGEQPAYSIFRSAIGGSSAVTVRPDGSGSYTFSEWGSDEVRGNTGSAASISGEVTWNCG